MTNLEEIESKLTENQTALDTAREELASAEEAADTALLESGPDALLKAQADLQGLKDRITAFERYAEVLEGQRQTAMAADAMPKMKELVATAGEAVKAEEAAYKKAVKAAGDALASLDKLRVCAETTTGELAKIRGLAASAGIAENAGGAVPRPMAMSIQMGIEREI